MSKLIRIELSGYDAIGDRIGTVFCRDKVSHLTGEPWVSPKKGKSILRERGAVRFKRVNVWPDGINPKLKDVA